MVHLVIKIKGDATRQTCQAFEISTTISFPSKEEKCKPSRATNDLLHRISRDALSVWKGKFRGARRREPNAKEIYNKEFLKMDALDAPEGKLLMPRIWGKPVTDETMSVGLQLERHCDATISDGSDNRLQRREYLQYTSDCRDIWTCDEARAARGCSQRPGLPTLNNKFRS